MVLLRDWRWLVTSTGGVPAEEEIKKMHNASSEHGPDEMPVREILQENQPFFECSVLLTRPSTSGQKPVCDGKKTTPRKIECQPECTFPTALVDTSQPEHLYTFPASGLGRLKKTW